MPFLSHLQLDRLSFWIGFLTGTLFWFVLSRLSREWPAIREGLRKWYKYFRQRQLAGTEWAIRQDVLRRAQRSHLASPLFSLDEIIIPPLLLAPPPAVQREETSLASTRFYERVITMLPDWPMFASRFGAPRISLLQALRGGTRLAIVGQVGVGKTTALAHLASQVAKRESDLGFAKQLTPIFIHFLDLESFLENPQDPVQPIFRVLQRQLPITAQPRLLGFLRSAFSDGEILLLLDGLDELPPERFDLPKTYLENLLAHYPNIRVVVAASECFVDGLSALGFEPLALAAWSQEQVNEFISRWGRLWTTHLSERIAQKTGSIPIDDVLLRGWIDTSPFYTPLEWTMLVWGAYAGDSAGLSIPQALEAYMTRFAGQSKALSPALATLAQAFLKSRNPALTIREIEQTIGDLPAFLDNEAEAPLPEEHSRPQPGKVARPGNRVLLALLDVGLLREYSNERIAFSHPILVAYLAASSLREPLQLPQRPMWCVEQAFLQFLSASPTTNDDWFSSWLSASSPPLHENLIHAFSLIRLSARTSPLRSSVMKQYLTFMQDETLAFGTRLRGLAACSTSNDPSTALLFRQWLKSESPVLRHLGALGCGILQDTQSLQDLIRLLNDPVEEVRLATCFALGQYRHPLAEEAILRALAFGDEMLRMAAAEVLANILPNGAEHLKEALTLEDLLTRRAAVFGMAQLDEPWVVDELERLVVEDSQWVVRNAAAQILESFHHPSPWLPTPLPPPHDTPWLIAFAAKLGQGVTPGQPIEPLLHQALIQGDDDEKLAAMAMIRRYPNPTYVKDLITLTHHENPAVRSTAHYTIWALSLTGIAV